MYDVSDDEPIRTNAVTFIYSCYAEDRPFASNPKSMLCFRASCK